MSTFATRINAADHRIQLASGRGLDYDYLIYAAGSTGAVPSTVPGATEFAYPVAEFELAQRLRARLDDLHPNAPVTVVGGGLTGIETASELAGQQRTVPGGAKITSGHGCPSRCCSPNRTRRPTWCSPNRCRWRCWCCWRR